MEIIEFRDGTPERRKGRRVCVNYTSYRKTLKEDFKHRCGYCGSFDKIFKRSFAIDHFIPQNPIGFTHTLPPNDYYNLVYSCGYCNGAKLNKWPTKDIKKPNDGKVGFIDPTDPIYDSLFCRNSEGSIMLVKSTHLLSIYLYKEIDLCNPVHSILWKIEKLDVSIDKLKELSRTSSDPQLKIDLGELAVEYHNLIDELFA